MIKIIEETSEIEGKITKTFRDRVWIKTDDNKEYSFLIQSSAPYSDIVDSVRTGKRLKIIGSIDKNEGTIINIEEIWLNIDL